MFCGNWRKLCQQILLKIDSFSYVLIIPVLNEYFPSTVILFWKICCCWSCAKLPEYPGSAPSQVKSVTTVWGRLRVHTYSTAGSSCSHSFVFIHLAQMAAILALIEGALFVVVCWIQVCRDRCHPAMWQGDEDSALLDWAISGFPTESLEADEQLCSGKIVTMLMALNWEPIIKATHEAGQHRVYFILFSFFWCFMLYWWIFYLWTRGHPHIAVPLEKKPT